MQTEMGFHLRLRLEKLNSWSEKPARNPGTKGEALSNMNSHCPEKIGAKRDKKLWSVKYTQLCCVESRPSVYSKQQVNPTGPVTRQKNYYSGPESHRTDPQYHSRYPNHAHGPVWYHPAFAPCASQSQGLAP